MNSLRPVGIVGLGSYLPAKKLTNADFEKMVDTSNEWIISRTGIAERRITTPEETASVLGTRAAQKALEDAGVAASELDLIIVPTVTPDMLFPSTACLIQEKIGAKNAAAFDILAGCTGFLYGLAIANQFVAAGMYNTVLVVATETLSKITDYEDRGTCVLFGDGAGAAVVRSVGENEGFLSFELGADGGGADLLCLPAGGFKKSATLETVKNKEHFLFMAGNEVFKFAVRIMEEAALKALEKAGLTREDVDFLVPHQANTRIIDSAVRRLGLSRDKVIVNLDKYGNMSGASIPVALDEAVKSERINKGDIVVLVGFGAGLTWGSCVLKWSK